jgi:hypothetical protein
MACRSNDRGDIPDDLKLPDSQANLFEPGIPGLYLDPEDVFEYYHVF